MPGSWTILVPVEVLEGETLDEDLLELVSTVQIIVLGYHVLPEQTPPDQARIQFEEAAQAKLDDLAGHIREAGGDAETRLVFTNDEEQTIDRVANEAGARVILIPNPATDVDSLLIPIT
ncbi:MAG: universal stress protein, partial [Salinirussus sp.]